MSGCSVGGQVSGSHYRAVPCPRVRREPPPGREKCCRFRWSCTITCPPAGCIRALLTVGCAPHSTGPGPGVRLTPASRPLNARAGCGTMRAVWRGSPYLCRGRAARRRTTAACCPPSCSQMAAGATDGTVGCLHWAGQAGMVVWQRTRSACGPRWRQSAPQRPESRQRQPGLCVRVPQQPTRGRPAPGPACPPTRALQRAAGAGCQELAGGGARGVPLCPAKWLPRLLCALLSPAVLAGS